MPDRGRPGVPQRRASEHLRAATRPDATFAVVASIAGLRMPFVATQIMPFAILLGGILAFWRLARSSELIVARAAGISAWGFLSGPLVVA